jgi:hypothetical protein
VLPKVDKGVASEGAPRSTMAGGGHGANGEVCGCFDCCVVRLGTAACVAEGEAPSVGAACGKVMSALGYIANRCGMKRDAYLEAAAKSYDLNHVHYKERGKK